MREGIEGSAQRSRITDVFTQTLQFFASGDCCAASIDPQHLDGRFVLRPEAFTPTMICFAASRLPAGSVAGAAISRCGNPRSIAANHAAHRVDPVEYSRARRFHVRGQTLHEITAAERIGHFGHAVSYAMTCWVRSASVTACSLAAHRLRRASSYAATVRRPAPRPWPAVTFAPRCYKAAARSASSPRSARGSAASAALVSVRRSDRA